MSWSRRSIACVVAFFLGDARLEILARVGVPQPAKGDHTERQAYEQGNDEHPDPDTTPLSGHLFLWQRSHAPIGRGWVVLGRQALRTALEASLLWPCLRLLRVCAAQCFEIGAAILTKSTAGRVPPGAIWTGDQGSISNGFMRSRQTGIGILLCKQHHAAPGYRSIRGSSASRRPFPIRLIDSAVRKIIMPGKKTLVQFVM